QRAFVETPRTLALIVGPAALLLPWALLRRYSHALAYASWVALAGIGVACVGFGTQWAFDNAFIPGVFFPSLAIGVAAGRLVSSQSGLPAGAGAGRIALRAAGRQPRFRPLLVF